MNIQSWIEIKKRRNGKWGKYGRNNNTLKVKKKEKWGEVEMRKRNGMTENFKLFEKREQIRDTRKGKIWKIKKNNDGKRTKNATINRGTRRGKIKRHKAINKGK